MKTRDWDDGRPWSEFGEQEWHPLERVARRVLTRATWEPKARSLCAIACMLRLPVGASADLYSASSSESSTSPDLDMGTLVGKSMWTELLMIVETHGLILLLSLSSASSDTGLFFAA